MAGRSSPGPATIAALAVAVVAISSSAPLIVYAAAPAIAVAFWRNAMATAVLAPFAATTARAGVADLLRPAHRRALVACVLAGFTLAVHFATWIPSTRLTTIAASTGLLATQPVWQGLIAQAQGARLGRAMWTAIVLAVVGAMVATGADVFTSGRAFAGDLLALAGALAAAGYTAFGERARRTVSTTVYTSICYGMCAVLIGVPCLLIGVPLHGYPATTWLALVGATAGPQLLGHSMFNYALHRTSATTISVLVLLEIPGAGLIGWLWLGQTPRPAQLPGLALLICGVLAVISLRRRPGSTPTGSPQHPDPGLAPTVPDAPV